MTGQENDSLRVEQRRGTVSDGSETLTQLTSLADPPGDLLWTPVHSGAEEMIKDTKANVFADRDLKYLVTTGAGKEVRGA